MFRIKICGVTAPEDALHAVHVGADAVGLNFFRGSKRRVTVEAARRIVQAVGSDRVVGVFVNESPETLMEICDRAGIKRVQLHGDETASDAARIRLWRIKAVHAEQPVELDALEKFPCEAFLLDAGGAGEYGGTGRTLRWEAIPLRFGCLGKPWALAGGLTPENVEKAISAARPFGVDTASGVESEPGRKDQGKVEAFIENARAGFRNAEK
ncbi:MAG: phosphoribosylanthranilate isomerase [Syntrophorhabdaceae bacterium]|nr:phosphoribosylanthranilate isomerase [Syntrophorhabdaceae bacterium]